MNRKEESLEDLVLLFDSLNMTTNSTTTRRVNGYTIDPSISFEDRGKIPAIVRDLPDFFGDPREINQWVRDVEDVLELYDDLKTTFQFHLLLKTIRRKIKGEANEVLITNNVQLEWTNIRETLRLYYADKRDLMTLDHQLKSSSRDRNESIESYYARIQELLTLISSNISSSDAWIGHESALIKLYCQISLDVFIRGLGEPLSLFCKNFKPANLAEAYNYCTEYVNINTRNSVIKPSQPTPVPAPRPLLQNRPSLPNRTQPFLPRQPITNNSQPTRSSDFTRPNNTFRANNYNQVNSRPPYNNFQNQLDSRPPTNNFQNPTTYRSPNNNNFQNQTNYRPPNNNWQLTPPPQPMEVDPSLQVSRPTPRRSATPSMQVFPPAKRVANTVETVEDEAWYVEQAEAVSEALNEQETELEVNQDNFLEFPSDASNHNP